MYTNIHAYDNESILKVSSIQTMRTTYFSDCTASNQINFNDIDLKHESYEVKFNFNDQPTFNNKDHMNLNDFGYFNIESDLDSCIDDHDFLSFQKVNDQSTSLQTYSNLKQTYLNIAPENDADSPITSTQIKLSFESELSKLCNLINSPNSDLNKLLDEVVFSTLNDSSMTNNEAESKSSIAELNITKDSNSTKRMRKSQYQTKILKSEFKRNQFWNKEDIELVCKKSGLKYYQVYKWFWEQQKKNNLPQLW